MNGLDGGCWMWEQKVDNLMNHQFNLINGIASNFGERKSREFFNELLFIVAIEKH